jgi:hypothetical protein
MFPLRFSVGNIDESTPKRGSFALSIVNLVGRIMLLKLHNPFRNSMILEPMFACKVGMRQVEVKVLCLSHW